MRKKFVTTTSLLALTTIVAGSAMALGPQPPDFYDLFVINGRANIALVLDTSGSMAESAAPSLCPWYVATVLGGALGPMDTKEHQLKASLVGCTSANDGILDRWSATMNFEMRWFDAGTGLGAPFGSSKAVLEGAVLSTGLGGATHMTQALAEAGRDFATYFNDGNTAQCRPNFILFLSDGNPNGGPGDFDYEADAPNPSDFYNYGAGSPWCGSAYLSGLWPHPHGNCRPGAPGNHEYFDMLANVTGNQDIKTYSLGFGLGGSFSPSNLQNIADNGEGLYFYAANVQSLDLAFNAIINSMSPRTRVSLTQPSVQLDGLFSGNQAYVASFRPIASRPDEGNIKSNCLLPPLLANGTFDPTVTWCSYLADPVDPPGAAGPFSQLIANPNPFDWFSWTWGTATNSGGVGLLARNRLIANPTGYPRNLVTYRPGTPTLFAVSQANLAPDDVYIHGIARLNAINRLHGYALASDTSDNDGVFEDDSSGLDPSDGLPVAVANWPIGDPMNSGSLLLRYNAPVADYLFMPANDGFMHVFRATDGFETQALMPGELLAPRPDMNFSLHDQFDVLNQTVRKPYMIDGQPRLFHADLDGDLRIDAGERAAIFVGFGRGGHGYLQIPVNTFNGTFTVANNPIIPLMQTPGTHYADLADTWSAPWLGRMRIGGVTQDVAIFGSGHERGWDYPVAQVPSTLPGEWTSTPQSVPLNMNCLPAPDPLLVAYGFNPAWCNALYMPFIGYQEAFLGLGPLDLVVGPLAIPGAIAYRAVFSQFGAQPGDRLEMQSGEGSTAEVLMGPNVGPRTSQWVYDDQFNVRVVLDGVDTAPGAAYPGFVLDRIEYLTAAPGANRVRAPSLFVVDINNWNGGAYNDPTRAFGQVPTGDGGMLLRFTSDCNGADVGTRCFDPTVGAAYSDLAYMKCSITGEPSVLDVSGRVERIYFADECSQIWRVMQGGAPGSWTINRIFHTNSDIGAAGTWPSTATFQSSRIRKVQTRLDLVRSRCTGRNAIGIYYGTGDIQNAIDEVSPQSPNLMIALWDDGTLGSGATASNISNLANVTALTSIDPLTMTDPGGNPAKGWFISLRSHEHMVRNPLVFAQRAVFKTFQPTTSATECNGAAGTNTTYTFDSCTSAATYDPNNVGVADAGTYAGAPGSMGTVTTPGDRAGSSELGDVGMAPMLVANRDTVVVLGDASNVAPKSQGFRRKFLLNWRLDGR